MKNEYREHVSRKSRCLTLTMECSVTISRVLAREILSGDNVRFRRYRILRNVFTAHRVPSRSQRRQVNYREAQFDHLAAFVNFFRTALAYLILLLSRARTNNRVLRSKSLSYFCTRYCTSETSNYKL